MPVPLLCTDFLRSYPVLVSITKEPILNNLPILLNPGARVFRPQ